MKSKALLAVICAVLLVGATMFGTLAWLTDKTTEVKNTFTVGNINITLTEEKPQNQTAKVMPGIDKIDKDPKVTVKSGSEACWLFVQIVEDNWPTCVDEDDNRKVDYDVAEGWTALKDQPGVYYREVDAATVDLPFPVLLDDKVTVSDDLTKAEMDAMSEFTLTFTAYAVQKDGVADATTAWGKIPVDTPEET